MCRREQQAAGRGGSMRAGEKIELVNGRCPMQGKAAVTYPAGRRVLVFLCPLDPPRQGRLIKSCSKIVL